MKLVFGKVVSEPCKIVFGIEKWSYVETNKYNFLQLVVWQPWAGVPGAVDTEGQRCVRSEV